MNPQIFLKKDRYTKKHKVGDDIVSNYINFKIWEKRASQTIMSFDVNKNEIHIKNCNYDFNDIIDILNHEFMHAVLKRLGIDTYMLDNIEWKGNWLV